MKKKESIRILFVETDKDNIKLMRNVLFNHSKSYHLVIQSSLHGVKEYLSEFKPSIIIAQLNLPDGKGTDLLDPDPDSQQFPVIVTASRGNEHFAVDVIKAGALDFVICTVDAIKAMPRIIGRILREWEHITKRRLAERKKNESEEKYRTLFTESKDAVFVSTLDGKLTDINPAGMELLGYSSKVEIKSINISRNFCLNPEDWKRFNQNINDQGFVKDFQLDLKKQNGEKIVVLVTAVRIRNEKQNVTAYTGIMRDITEKLRDEQKLLEMNIELLVTNNKLKEFQASLIQQEKLASLGQLAAGVAHELNNPLGFIISNFKTLKKYFETILEYIKIFEEIKSQLQETLELTSVKEFEKVEEFKKHHRIETIIEDIKDIYNESYEGFERMGLIVDSLRGFSRVDFENKIADYDLNKGVGDTLTVAQNEIKYVAEVETDLSEIPIIMCKGDEINQVLLSIIVNAAQAIKSEKRKEKGKIKIRTYEENGNVCCEISDDGPGISKEIIGKIFDPFFSTKEVGEGTGLGLNISHQIVINKHKGELAVESEPGNGSVFTIKLPIESKIKQGGDNA